MDELKVVKVTRRIPAETYGYYEVELEGFTSLGQIISMADEDRKKEAKVRFDCGHLYTKTDSGKSKTGVKWERETCIDPLCGAVRWVNPDGTKSGWSFPVRS
jgi:hypothetical protein